MTEKEKRLVKEINEKFTLAQNKKAEDNFNSNFDKWEDYYSGTSEELEDRENRGLSHIMPAWAQAGVDYILAKEVAVIFGQKPYFTVGARAKKWEKAAKIQTELLTFRLDNSAIFLNVVQWLQSKLIYGTSIRKPCWDRKRDRPKIENIDAKNFYPSPNGTSIYEVPWVIQRALRSREYIEAMGIPYKGSQKSTYKNTKELLSEKGGQWISEAIPNEKARYTEEEKENTYEILEYWEQDRVVTIGERRIVLREDENPYKKKKAIPYIVMIDWPKPKSFWGMGRIETIEPHIKELAHIKNQRFDNINLILNPPLKYLKGMEIDLDRLPIKPNALIGMDDLNALQPLMDRGWPFVTQNVYEESKEIEKEIQNRLGLYEYWMGKAPEQRETATGIARLQAAGNTIFQFMNLMSLNLGMKELAEWTSAIDQQYFKGSISIPFLYDDEAVGEYLTITKSRLEGNFYFIPKVSPLNPETIKDVQRGQFVTAMQAILAMQANIKLEELAKVLLEQFDVPRETIDKILPEEMVAPGGAAMPGGAAPGGGKPPTELGQEISATSARAIAPPARGR